MPNYFFITGLPRSRTAWLAALFNTHEDVICLHEPINQFGSIEAVKKHTDALPYKYVGISDSSLSLYHEFFVENFNYAPIVFVKRNEDDVIKSLCDFMVISKDESKKIIADALSSIDKLAYKLWEGRIAKYNELNECEVINDIWNYCIPSIPFDEKKCEIFQKLLINQHKEKVLAEMEISDNESILTDN